MMARSARPPEDSPRHGTPRYVSQRYRLDTPIGRGGAGVVWCGEDELLQRPVAVKEILVPLAGAQAERDAIRARVLREARALARLHSPAIVSVYDVVEEAERHWIVMELVDADSLGDVIRADGPLSPEQAAAIGLALTDALAAAHSAGVLHRDIKPGNVLLGRDGRVRLTDFGIAATDGDSTLTGTGALVGSPAYIAPERVRGSSGSPASDLWGLGATLYAAVEGQPPFEGPETYAVLTAVVEGRRRPFRLAGPLRGLLTDLLDRPAEERPGVAEIRRRLVPIAGGVAPVPASVINSRPRPGVTALVPGSGLSSDPSSDLLENVDGDAAPTADSNTHTAAASPTTADEASDATEIGTEIGEITEIASTDGAVDVAAPSPTRTATGPQHVTTQAGSGDRNDAMTGLAVETRPAPSLDKVTAVAGTTALTVGRGSPIPLDPGGYSFEQTSDLDGLLLVSGGTAVGPPGRDTPLDRPGKRKPPTSERGRQPPVRRGVVVAVAAGSVAVGVAIALSAILAPGDDSNSQLQSNGDHGGVATATVAGESSTNPSDHKPTLDVPANSGRFTTHRTSPTAESTPVEPTPVETTTVAPSSAPTDVHSSPTTPATPTSAPTSTKSTPGPTGSATAASTP